MAIDKKGMQYNSAAPKETVSTRDLSGKMQGKPQPGKPYVSGGGGSSGGNPKSKKGKMGY